MEKEKQFGNFKVDNDGNIFYYVGWCCLEYKDIENMKKSLKELEKFNKVEDNGR